MGGYHDETAASGVLEPEPGEPGHPHRRPVEGYGHGRLSARPGPSTESALGAGTVSLDLGDGGPAALAFVPEADGGGPYRLMILLHGAGGNARQGLDLMFPVAPGHRLLLVAPQSVAPVWDLISPGFGPDVRRLDRVLSRVYAACRIEGTTIGGFSDGASYALSLGLTNGDLFDSVMAFSPGFAAPMVTHGSPRVFISHGTTDRVLPIDRCSRRLVPRLLAQRYDVTYEEFAGGHEVPAGIVRHALRWLHPPQ